MAFWAVKIKFSWSLSMALSWTRCGEGNYSSPRPQLHLTLHFLTNHYWKVNSNPAHLEQRVVLSAWIAILQITSSERSLMYSRTGVVPRMEHWGSPALTGYSCENLTIQNNLEPSITEIRQNKAKYLIWNSTRFKFLNKTRMPNPVKSLEYIKGCSWSSPRPIKTPSNP